MSEGEDDEVSTLTPRVESLERRSNQYEKDIRFIYREMRWLRHGMTSLLGNAGLDLPADEPADDE